MRTLLSGLLFTLLTGCTDEKPRVLHAFSDGTATSWELKLYQDQTFYLYLPASDNTGQYYISGDTVYLAYAENRNGTWPKKFFIDTVQRRVVSLDLANSVTIELQEYKKEKPKP